MSKKVISILLSAAMIVAMLCVGFGAVTAAADGTYTYYFLADTNYLEKTPEVGAYWWTPSENAPWPGQAIEAAPEIGENVFKVEAPTNTVDIIFNAFFDAQDDPELIPFAPQTVNINTEGYEAGECPYDDTLETDNFDGWIYVLDTSKTTVGTDVSSAVTTEGAWFKVDDYKNYEQYYGSYDFVKNAASTDAATDSEPATDAATDSEPATDTAPAATTKYHAGDVVAVEVKVANLALRNGDDAYLAGYNYEIKYNTAVAEVVLDEDENAITSSIPTDNYAANEEPKGTLLAADAGQKGFGKDADVKGGEVVLTATFNVTANTDDLGIEGKCTTLSAVSTDKKASVSEKLVGAIGDPEREAGLTEADMVDKYTSYEVKVVKCDHNTTDTETDTDTTTDSEKPTGTDSEKPAGTDSEKPAGTDSAKDSDKKTSDSDKKTSDSDKKNTNDKADSDKKNSSSGNNSNGSTPATVQTAGTFAVVSLVVILMAAAAVVLYTRKKTEE